MLRGEELGFHSAWVAEHHFSRYGLGPSSLIVIGSIAPQTKSIRLGTAVLVPPLHHPVRLAEDTATVDVISGGRLDVGFGRGSAQYEYRGYDIDHEESQMRFQETINLVKGLWTNSDYSYDGQYFNVHRANLVPQPIQKPHPAVYIAATRTQATLEYAVSTGHPLVIGVMLDTPDALDLCRRFVQMSQESGKNVPMSRIPFFRYFYVAETEGQAREDTRTALDWNLDITHWRRSLKAGSEVNQSLEHWRNTRTELPPSYDYLYENRAIIGTPDQCVAKLMELRAQGIEYFVCNIAFGSMEHRKVMGSMELFANEVMPRLQ